MSEATPPAPTVRSRAKANRRDALLSAAARLFATRGFNGVSIEDLGSAVGISGRAVYRHFPSKEAVLEALLVGVSEDLLSGGRAVLEAAPDSRGALQGLVRFHVDFALDDADVIRVQDRDLDSLDAADRREVRALQRRYVELWVGVLAQLHRGADPAALRIRAQATFGLINSTPHSAKLGLGSRGGIPRAAVRALLEEMALATLAPAPRL